MPGSKLRSHRKRATMPGSEKEEQPF
jgi:hypothetical protein